MAGIAGLFNALLSPPGQAVIGTGLAIAGGQAAQAAANKYPVTVFSQDANKQRGDRTVRLPGNQTAGGRDINERLTRAGFTGRGGPTAPSIPSVEDLTSFLLDDSAAMYDAALAHRERTVQSVNEYDTQLGETRQSMEQGKNFLAEGQRQGRAAFQQAGQDISAAQAVAMRLPQDMASSIQGYLNEAKGIYNQTIGLATDAMKQTIDFAAQKADAFIAGSMGQLRQAKAQTADQLASMGYTQQEIEASQRYLDYGMGAQLTANIGTFMSETIRTVSERWDQAMKTAESAGATYTAAQTAALNQVGSAVTQRAVTMADLASQSKALAEARATWEASMSGARATYNSDTAIALLNGYQNKAALMQLVQDPVQLLGPIFLTARSLFQEEHMLDNADKQAAAAQMLGPAQIVIDGIYGAVSSAASNRAQVQAAQAANQRLGFFETLGTLFGASVASEYGSAIAGGLPTIPKVGGVSIPGSPGSGTTDP